MSMHWVLVGLAVYRDVSEMALAGTEVAQARGREGERERER